MKKLITFAQLFFIFYFTAFSQAVHEDNRFVPPSPTVSELSKYGKIPVSHYTGIPNISIPLYTLQCGQLSLPITLSYHAGGIRVDQIASWVGTGWSLNAGGVISSSVMGLSDVERTAYSVPQFDFNYFSNYDFPFPSYSDASQLATNNIDSQPDIYSYNFLNHSGQFVQDMNSGDIYEIRNNKEIKISRNGSIFTITDSHGTIYEFSHIERTSKYITFFTGRGDSSSQEGLPTGWFLTSITSADGIDKINFTYEQENQEYNTPRQGKISYDSTVGRWVDQSGIGSGLPFSFTESNVKTTTYRLSEINAYTNCNNGNSNGNSIARIRFSANSSYANRSDLFGSKRLESISVEEGSNIIKQWDFGYNYFAANPGGSFYDSNKLRLDFIVEDGEKKHRFKYYGDSANEPKMPHRLSFCGYDYWGYFNGPISNDTYNLRKLFTNSINVTFKTSFSKKKCEDYSGNAVTHTTPSVNIQVTHGEGSKKEPDIEYMKTYTLKEIHYPTGGYTKFDYEAHDYSMTRSERFNSDRICGGLRIKSIEDWDNGELKEQKSYRYKLWSWSNEAISDVEGEMSSGCIFDEFKPFKMKSLSFIDNSGWYVTQNIIELNSSSYTSMYSLGGDYIGYSDVTEVSGNGVKRYNFRSINSFSPQDESLVNYAWYNTSNNPAQIGRECSLAGSVPFENPFPPAGYGGSHGRGLVNLIETYDISGKLVSSEVYEYHHDPELNDTIYGMEVIENPYNSNPYADCLSYGLVSSNGSSCATGLGYYIKAYSLITGQTLLMGKTTTLYNDPQNENGITTTEAYEYNGLNQLRRVDVWHADGRNEATTYKYPSDILDDNVMTSMKSSYIIAPVVKTEKIVNNSIVSADWKRYIHLGFGMYRPDIIFQLETTSPISINQNYSSLMKEKIHYSYNQYGKVSWFKTNDGIPVVYLWSYAGQYPVAEIRNATYEQVRTALGGDSYINELANESTPQPSDFTKIVGLRASLSQAHISTFTYKPLVGMLTATDPRGITTYYDYDTSGRLKETYIYENRVKKILQSYDYHYRPTGQ